MLHCICMQDPEQVRAEYYRAGKAAVQNHKITKKAEVKPIIAEAEVSKWKYVFRDID